jgi:hypothetical protein
MFGGASGYFARSPEHATSTADAAAHCPKVESDPEPFALRPSHVASATPRTAIAASDDEATEAQLLAHRRTQSREVLAALSFQTNAAKLVPHATSPEATAAEVDMYVAGWADALMRGAPELVDELAEEIERSMCAPDADDAQLLVLVHAVSRVPELANARGLECLLSREQEDVVLWNTLDAWKVSVRRLAPSDVLARLENSAQDKRTLDRLAAIRSPEQHNELKRLEQLAVER